MYTLYGKGGQRHAKIAWLLNEMGIAYETVPLDLLPGDPSYDKLLSLNPFAKVPILQQGEFVVWESAAISSFLIDKHRQRPLAPPAGTPERATHDQWFYAAHTDLEEPLWTIAKHKIFYPENLRSQGAVAAARAEWTTAYSILESQIPAKGFMTGDSFTAADIALSYVLNWSRRIKLFEDKETQFRKSLSYLWRCLERPSCAIPKD